MSNRMWRDFFLVIGGIFGGILAIYLLMWGLLSLQDALH